MPTSDDTATMMTKHACELCSVPRKLVALLRKGMLLDTLCGVWPRKLLLERRPALWDELDATDKVRYPVVLTGSSIMRLWDDAAQHLVPFPLMNRAFGGSCTWHWVVGGGHGDPARRVAEYDPTCESGRSFFEQLHHACLSA